MAERVPNIFPLLYYDDPDAALDFLTRAFGMRIHAEHRDAGGRLMHGELALGAGIVMIGPREREGRTTPAITTPVSIYVGTERIDALFQSAKAAGAKIAFGLIETDYGSRDFGAYDPSGNLWCFGTYLPRADRTEG